MTHHRMKALTIRQPWAWCIVNAGKDIENRGTHFPHAFRGPLLIHAGKTLDREALADIRDEFPDVTLPAEADFERGGIVGLAHVKTIVKSYPSRWFYGPYGLVLERVVPLPFTPLRGQQGLFEVDLAAVGLVDRVGAIVEAA